MIISPPPRSKNAYTFGLLLVAVLLGGCASFPGGQYEKVTVPKVAHYEVKPSAYLDVRFFQGRPDAGNAVEIPALKSKTESVVDSVVRESDIFSSYTFDAFAQDTQDHAIQLYFYNYGDAGAAGIMGALCGASFGIIPAAATDKYALTSKVQTKGKEPLAAARSDDKITTWMGLWFIPFMGNTPDKAANQTFEGMTRDALRQLIATRQLKLYSKKARPVATRKPAASVPVSRAVVVPTAAPTVATPESAAPATSP